MKTTKLLLGAVFCFLGLNFIFASNAIAGQCYRDNGREDCLNDSGGRQDYHSINYACDKASALPQNACASWLGPAGNSASREVHVAKGATTADLSIYGMCTDKADTTSSLSIGLDGGSIYNYGQHLDRGAPWGTVGTMTGVKLNVAKFKNGAAVIVGDGVTIYMRVVWIVRCHSDGGSCDHDLATIWLIEDGAITPPPETDPCPNWAPDGTPGRGASANYGVTDTEVKIKNANPRFASHSYGRWGDGMIYAMPTDEIRWVECYYGGVPGTAHTRVSSVNGTKWNNGAYLDLDYNWCQFTVGAINELPVIYSELYPAYNAMLSPNWENKFTLSGHAKEERPGDSIKNGDESGPYPYDQNKTVTRNNGYTTILGDAGKEFQETETTGSPVYVNIRDATTGPAEIYKSACPPKIDYDTIIGYDYSNPKVDPVTGKITYPPIYRTYVTYDCWTCTNKYKTPLYDASVLVGPNSDTAKVRVPYNYENYTGVILGSGDVYSGEYTLDVRSVWTSVEPKYNSKTLATYATQVPNAEIRIFAYVTDNPNGGMSEHISNSGNGCSEVKEGKLKQCINDLDHDRGTLNGEALLEGKRENHNHFEHTYNAFDATAGDYICVASQVKPATSGADDSIDEAGDGKWRYSNPTCKMIAKRPSFQVWGDSMYSKGSVSNTMPAKRNMYDKYFAGPSPTNLCKDGNCFKTNGGSETYFGSWIEESLIIRDGITSNVASGAATGWYHNYTDAGWDGGDFCEKRSPLTFSNDCGNDILNKNTAGKSGIPSYGETPDSLIEYWTGDKKYKGACQAKWGGSCSVLESASGKDIYYIEGASSVSGTIPPGTTYLVKGANITVGNLRYQDANYSSLGDIPKVVIYASGKINISCGATEVDAILLAKGNISTCEAGDDSDPARGDQLKIFGTAMAQSVTLGRTYGSAAWDGRQNGGQNTNGLAAEIFDYDSTILMWSEYMSGAQETDTLQTTYQHELAPRY